MANKAHMLKLLRAVKEERGDGLSVQAAAAAAYWWTLTGQQRDELIRDNTLVAMFRAGYAQGWLASERASRMVSHSRHIQYRVDPLEE